MQTDAGAVEGGAPAFDLGQFVSRFTALHTSGAELRGHCPFCDSGDADSLAVSTEWRSYCCNSHDLHGADQIGFYACWTNTDRIDAAAKLGNGAGLPDAKPVEQVPLKRLPYWGGWALEKPHLKDAVVWIHELSGAVIMWRKLAPERVHLGLIHGESTRNWSGLAERRIVLFPEANAQSRERMATLAGCLYLAGHKQVMCLDPGLDERFGTRLLPEPGEDVLKWAKAHSERYPTPNELYAAPEPQPVPSVAPATPGEAREAAPGLPGRAEAHAKGNGGAGAPMTPSERVQAHEAQARAQVLSGLVYTCIADVQPEAVRWLWPGRIPLGELTMIVGDPGLGKSQICASLASVVTNGGQWPVDRSRAEQGSVLILSAEDNVKHTICPRLDAAGAEVNRCHTLQAVKREADDGTHFEGGFSLALDLAKLSVLMDELRDVRMVIINPLSAYLGETDSHKNAEVRGMLAPLTTLAGAHNAAILLVSHLTKSQSANALMRVKIGRAH